MRSSEVVFRPIQSDSCLFRMQQELSGCFGNKDLWTLAYGFYEFFHMLNIDELGDLVGIPNFFMKHYWSMKGRRNIWKLFSGRWHITEEKEWMSSCGYINMICWCGYFWRFVDALSLLIFIFGIQSCPKTQLIVSVMKSSGWWEDIALKTLEYIRNSVLIPYVSWRRRNLELTLACISLFAKMFTEL